MPYYLSPPLNTVTADNLSDYYTKADGATVTGKVKPEPATHTVTASAGANGSISPSGSVKINDGESKTFTFTANSGYEVDKVTVDDVEVTPTTATSHTIANVYQDFAIHVTFKSTSTTPTESTVTVNQNGGNGSPSGAGNYAEGATVTIKAGTRSGYSFSGWTVTSGSVILTNANSNTTTFTMPANAVTVTANWSRNSSGGGGSSSGGGSYTPPPKTEIKGEVNVAKDTATFKTTEKNIVLALILQDKIFLIGL